MIAYIKGILMARLASSVVIEVGGVGMQVGMSSYSIQALPDVGQVVQVHTYLHVREDALTLFGFVSTDEKSLFEKLISVSGIGPKVALAALSTSTPQALTNAIMSNDVTLIQRIPGVGKKTAQRIILELQGSLEALGSGEEKVAAKPLALHDEQARAVEDLLAMGFTSSEAELALQGAPDQAQEAALVQYALRRLGA